MKLVLFILLLSISAFAAWQSTTVIEVAKIRSAKATHGIHVEFDISTLLKSEQKSGENGRISIDIEPGKRVYLDVKSIKHGKLPDDFSWFGKVAGENGDAILSVRHGKIAGTIRTNDATYSIVPFENHYIVVKKDSSQKIPFKDKIVFEKPRREAEASESLSHHNLIHYKERKIQTRTTNTTVDVLVLYTASLKNEYAAGTEAKIQNAFDIAYNAYINSNALVSLNLVNMQQLPATSTLNDDSDLEILLDRLKADGYAAHLRRTYDADMLVVVGRYVAQDFGGLAFTPEDPDSSMVGAFATVLMCDYCSDLSFAHELGHNFACSHDRDHTTRDETGKTMYDYGFGYDIPNEFATIMSYDEPEISFFSNPSLTYNGQAIGNAATEDNAHVIRNTRAKIADNSDEIDESLEAGDSISGLNIDGVLEAKTDRDAFTVNLGGSTTFNGNSGSSQWRYFISVYSHDYERVAHFDNCDDNFANCTTSVTVNLPSAEYKVLFTKTGDKYNWTEDTTSYDIDITTNYTPPADTPCDYSISSLEETVSRGGESKTVGVTSSPNNCNSGSWSASENLSWVTLSGDTQGSGKGSWNLNYTVPASYTGRIGTFDIANSTHKINQAGFAMVYDERTNLYWQDEEYTSAEDSAYNNSQLENGKVKYWDNAVSYCKNSNYIGYKDWRLPTKTELESIVNTSNTPKIESAFYYRRGAHFWSSTLYPTNTARVYTLNYASGTSSAQTKDDYVNYIRCVRKSSANAAIIMYLLN